MPGNQAQPSSYTTRQQPIALPNDKAALDDVFRVVRENHAMAGQTLSTVMAANALILGLTGVLVALAIALLTFQPPTKSVLNSVRFEIGVSTETALWVFLGYGFFLVLYLVAYTMLPTMRLIQRQRELVVKSVDYACSNLVEEKRAILQDMIGLSTTSTASPIRRQGQEQRSSARHWTFSSYALILNILILLLAAGTSIFVILSRIPAP